MKYSVNSVWENKDAYDIVVIGAGHAGCEAALACARLGFHTIMFTVSVDSVALMPCSPSIGGTSKGHLVREVDALGGEMGKIIDHTFIQSKMLNRSKGPAVHSLRAQADKNKYSRIMRQVLEKQERLEIKQMEIVRILVDGGKNVTGVQAYSGAVYHCRAVILCTGTYLNAKCVYGEVSAHTGPNGLQAANYLTDSLKKLGIQMCRFKTGTPARVDGDSLDFSKMEEQFGDEQVTPFSFTTHPDDVQIPQASCWLTYTNQTTHDIIRENLGRSPLFSGKIEGTGPRYCPSIEDKVVKFPDKERHQVFIEPQGTETNEMYIGGMSSSLPEDVQYAMYRSVPGLENAKIVRNAYAIEYDCMDARQLKPSLEFKALHGLFSAGQFNGSSGYEEAAAQGLIAGINAVKMLRGEEPLILDRSEAYIGVLIDDLVTKENKEPYRMMTSRAEYRLLLRQDNADQRLTEKGYEIGLVSEERYRRLLKKQALISREIERVKHVNLGMTANVQDFLANHNSPGFSSGISLVDLIKRPELSYQVLEELDPGRPSFPDDLREEIIEQVNISIKYEGYIKRQKRQVEQFKKLESKRIPGNFDYDQVKSLRIEALQKLKEYRPISIGQASRISGVSPADISVLLVYLENHRLSKDERKPTVLLADPSLPKKEYLVNEMRKISVSLNDKQAYQFMSYFQLLEKWNKVMNLTAIIDFPDVVKKHFVDSVIAGQWYDFSLQQKVLDLGSGAGFPGIPLKVVFPGLKMTLLDSLNKRIQFLNRVIEELKLKDVEAIHGRAEDFARQPAYREQFDLCVSRAVANLSVLSEYCLPFVKVGGTFISYKSCSIEEELNRSRRVVEKLGGRIDTVHPFCLPETDISRSIVIIKKTRETPGKYPRKAGIPAKKPFC